MICDTNFLSVLHDEHQAGLQGPAAGFLARHRRTPYLVTVISVGEVAVIFAKQADARRFLSRYRNLEAKSGDSLRRPPIDRELIAAGARLGENDTWSTAFSRYYGQPLISRDQAFAASSASTASRIDAAPDPVRPSPLAHVNRFLRSLSSAVFLAVRGGAGGRP